MDAADIAHMSGQDLSMAVSIEIYGYQWMHTENDRRMSFLVSGDSLAGLLGIGAVPGKTDDLFDVGPKHAEDDALAFQAADRMQLFENSYLLQRDTSRQGDTWVVTTPKGVYEDVRSSQVDPGFATGATRAEAVCRASLMLKIQ